MVSSSIRRATVFVVFALIFLSLASHAFNIHDYLASTESPASVTQTNTTVSGVSYTIYTIAGVDSLVVKNGAIVQNKSELGLVLESKCFATSYPKSSDLNKINSLLLSFNDSRQQPSAFGPREAYCDQIIGQSTANEGGCVDATSCQTACNQGSYTCLQYAEDDAQFLPALLDYANAKRGINSAINDVLSTTTTLEGVTGASQLSFSVSDNIAKISNDISNLQNDSSKFEDNPLFVNSNDQAVNGQQGLQLCIFNGENSISLNDSALSAASIVAAELTSGSSCFNGVSARTDQLSNQTSARVALYLSTNAKFDLQQQFNNLTATYNNLTDSAEEALLISNDTQLSQFITGVGALNAQYYTEIQNNQIDNASQTLSQINSTLNEFQTYLNSNYSTFNTLIDNMTIASDELQMANVVIEKNDVTSFAALSKLQNSYDSLTLVLESKISSNEAPNYSVQFESIANQTAALIETKKQLDNEQVPQLLSGEMQSISMAVLNSSASALGIKESDKRAWIANIPLIIIAFIDIVILAVFSAAFFFFVVRNTSEFTMPKVMRSWAIIFAVVLLLLIGLSFALSVSLSKETGAVSLFNFLTAMKSQKSLTIFVERSATDDPTSISGCANLIAGNFTALGLNVTTVNVIDGVCNGKPVANCISGIGQAPLITMNYSATNSTEFFTFYKPEAMVTGDENYFNECIFSKFIG